MKKLFIILFCACLGLSVMAGGQPLSPAQFKQAMAKAGLAACPATPGARPTAPLLLKNRQAFRMALGGDYPHGSFPGDLLERLEQLSGNFDNSESFGTWILDTEQYSVFRNEDGSYAVSDTCSYARGRALPFYVGEEDNQVIVGGFFISSIRNLNQEIDLPLTIYDDYTIGIPQVVYHDTKVLPSLNIHYRSKETTIYAIPEEWLNDDFENGAGEILGYLYDDGTIYFGNGFAFLEMDVTTSYEFDPYIVSERGNDGTIVTSCDTTYECMPVMRNLFLMPSNATHMFVQHKKAKLPIDPDVPADTTGTGGEGPIVVPGGGGFGGFGGFGESSGVTSDPTLHSVTSFHFGSEYGTCGYSGPVNRPPIGGGKPVNPPGTGTVRPHGGGSLPGVETLSIESLVLGGKLRSVVHQDEVNDTLLAPTLIYWLDDTTLAVYNLYYCGGMVEMYVRPDGSMYLPMQYLGICSYMSGSNILRRYDVYNYSATDATLLDMTPGNTGEAFDDGTICWGITVLYNEDYTTGYYYDTNWLFLNYDDQMSRSAEKEPTISDITRDINALLQGDSSLSITDLTTKINRLINGASQ